MPQDHGASPRPRLSRRQMLKGVGLAGAVAAAPPALAASPGPPEPQRDPPETLAPAEADTLAAVCARLIPSDDGPGAAEAHAARYIDRALGGFLALSREAYRMGLSSLNLYAMTARGAAFAALAPADQDAVLRDVEAGRAEGFQSSAAFFALVRVHTLQGTFGDPFYGGNADFVGWDMLGYPGVRMGATAQQQAMSAHTAPNHASAYDYAMFGKVDQAGRPLAPAQVALHDH